MSSADLETAGTSGRQETANGNTAGQATDMAIEAAAEQPGTSMRVLALYCTSSGSIEDHDKGFDPPDTPNINHLASRPGVEVSTSAHMLLPRPAHFKTSPHCSCCCASQLPLHPAPGTAPHAGSDPCMRNMKRK
jgi:hypothetical protein